MKKIFAVSLAALALVLSGCSGSDDDANADSPESSGNTIADHMDLQQASDDSTWTFETADGETCTVELLLDTPIKVQEHENAGDVVAVNPAGSAGVKLPADVSDSCHDTAIELLSDHD